MEHALLRQASSWLFLFSIDQHLAASARQKTCPCGERLHCANYPRKLRGGGKDLPESYGYRLSFCCDRDGWRRRLWDRYARPQSAGLLHGIGPAFSEFIQLTPPSRAGWQSRC